MTDPAPWMAELARLAKQRDEMRATAAGRFADDVVRTGVVAAHPSTIARLDRERPDWRAELHVRELVALDWLVEGQLYTGDAFVRPTAPLTAPLILTRWGGHD